MRSLVLCRTMKWDDLKALQISNKRPSLRRVCTLKVTLTHLGMQERAIRPGCTEKTQKPTGSTRKLRQRFPSPSTFQLSITLDISQQFFVVTQKLQTRHGLRCGREQAHRNSCTGSGPYLFAQILTPTGNQHLSKVADDDDDDDDDDDFSPLTWSVTRIGSLKTAEVARARAKVQFLGRRPGSSCGSHTPNRLLGFWDGVRGFHADSTPKPHFAARVLLCAWYAACLIGGRQATGTSGATKSPQRDADGLLLGVAEQAFGGRRRRRVTPGTLDRRKPVPTAPRHPSRTQSPPRSQ